MSKLVTALKNFDDDQALLAWKAWLASEEGKLALRMATYVPLLAGIDPPVEHALFAAFLAAWKERGRTPPFVATADDGRQFIVNGA